MSDELVSRRGALMAATAIGAIAGVSQGGEEKSARRKSAGEPLNLTITQPDGEVVVFAATKVVISFGDGGSLVATPSGIMPRDFSDSRPNPDSSPKAGFPPIRLTR